jgi:CBS domain-containing protein
MKTAVRDVMTSRVIWVGKDATFRDMAVALREYRVSAFPVVDADRKVIGVVSEADMLNKAALDDEPGVISGILHRRDQAKARGVTAGDLMTTAVVAVRPEDTVEHAARLMYDRGVKRLPVTTRAGTWSASSAGPTCSPSSTGPTRPSATRSPTTCSSASSWRTRWPSR